MKYFAFALILIGVLVASMLEQKALIVKEHDNMPKPSKEMRKKIVTQQKFTKEELEYEIKNAKILNDIGND